MITIQDYFQKVKEIEVSALPDKLKEEYEFVKEVTENHTTWDYYKSDADIQSTIDQYLANLSDYLKKRTPDKPASNSIGEKAAREAAKKFIQTYVLRGDTVQQLKDSQMGTAVKDFAAEIKGGKIHVTKLQGKEVNHAFPLQSIYNEIVEENGNSQASASKPSSKPVKPPKEKPAPVKRTSVRINTRDAKPVERVDEEIKFIKRYALMHSKIKTSGQILNFISSLQKAIVEKRIRKSSPFAREINYIQDNLVKLYNTMDDEVEIKINDKVLEKFLAIAGSEKVRLSVNYMKRYIGIQGKHITKEKAKQLYNLIANAINKNKIKGNDPYMDKMKRALSSLKNFAEVAKKDDTLHIHDAVLNGINEALEGCSCCDEEKEVLHGIDEPLSQQPVTGSPRDTVMNSMDFANLQFDTLGFMGKWKELIGDPAEGFTAMVFGKPKMGKSYLCVDMAGYLARHHGDTLYVAKEEKLDATLQKKLNDKNVKHPCLYVSDHLPDDLSPYQFIFLDSVNKLGLTPEDLERLKVENPGKSFIYIFQTTKEGNFRGANAFQHDVDVVIEIPEKGQAVQFGRFNQGGGMKIF